MKLSPPKRTLKIKENDRTYNLAPGDTYTLVVDQNLDLPGIKSNVTITVNYLWDGTTLNRLS